MEKLSTAPRGNTQESLEAGGETIATELVELPNGRIAVCFSKPIDAFTLSLEEADELADHLKSITRRARS